MRPFSFIDCLPCVPKKEGKKKPAETLLLERGSSTSSSSSTNSVPPSKSRLFAYPSQKTVLRWLPIETRASLVRRFPRVTKFERTVPLRFISLDFGSQRSADGVETVILRFDNFVFKIRRVAEKSSKVELKICSESGRNPGSETAIFDVETELSVNEAVRFLVEFFLDRPNTDIGKITVDKRVFRICRDMDWASLKVREKAIFSVTNLEQDCQIALLLDTPLLVFGNNYMSRDVRAILEKIKSSRRSVGSRVALRCRFLPSANIAQLCRDLNDLNSKMGTLRMDEDPAKVETWRGITTAPVSDCVFFEMEHADVSIGFLDYSYEQRNDQGWTEMATALMRVVEKGSVREEEPFAFRPRLS